MAQPLPERRLSLSEKLQSVADRLDDIIRDASNERRPVFMTDHVLDTSHELGLILCRIGRG